MRLVSEGVKNGSVRLISEEVENGQNFNFQTGFARLVVKCGFVRLVSLACFFSFARLVSEEVENQFLRLVSQG